MHKMGPWDPSTIFLTTSFTQKMPERSDSIYSSILIQENIWWHNFSWSSPNSQELVNLFQFSSGPRGSTIGEKLKIPCEFDPRQLNWWCHMFSRGKIEEYMEYELSNIFKVKVVAKNIVLGSVGTQR